MKTNETTSTQNQSVEAARHSTDGSAHFTPAQLARRWGWHVESVRRMLRDRRLASVIISRRRLIPLAEIERIETEGLIARAA